MQVVYVACLACALSRLNHIHTLVYPYTILLFVLCAPAQRFYLMFVVLPSFHIVIEMYKGESVLQLLRFFFHMLCFLFFFRCRNWLFAHL